MTVVNDDVLNVWGREFLKSRGYSLPSEDAVVEFSVDTEFEGCCEVCSSETAYLYVSSGSVICAVDSYSVKDMLLHLAAFAAGSK